MAKSTCPVPSLLPSEFPLEIAARIHADPDKIKLASSDFGKLVQLIPTAVLNPSSVNDIISLIKLSYNSSNPFSIAARGRAHSFKGQAMAPNGVVVNMTSMNNGNGIRVFQSPTSSSYADVGGEQLWIDVLRATLEHGLAPVSWTDYLYLTVGGTLSNAGISGQTFRHGPQISNVYEMDVVTGKGELVTCSKDMNSELFYAVLGGLGQFGIITRARIPLEPAPKRAKWVKMLYHDFSAFTKDQEHLISMDGSNGTNALNYLEGCLITHFIPPNNWRSSFFSESEFSRIDSLAIKHGLIYCLEVVKHYDNLSVDSVDEELQVLLEGLSFIPGYKFTKDVSIVEFLNRVENEEQELRSRGQWEVPHPWLDLFVPKSRIMDIESGVYKSIILEKQTKTTGPCLVYPMNRNKWDDRMSAVTPDEDIFYTVEFLNASVGNDLEDLENQNKEILQFCNEAGIKFKRYLPPYETKEDWMNHFGSKWNNFQEMKAHFDPKMILSPGQRIFNSI